MNKYNLLSSNKINKTQRFLFKLRFSSLRAPNLKNKLDWIYQSCQHSFQFKDYLQSSYWKKNEKLKIKACKIRILLYTINLLVTFFSNRRYIIEAWSSVTSFKESSNISSNLELSIIKCKYLLYFKIINLEVFCLDLMLSDYDLITLHDTWLALLYKLTIDILEINFKIIPDLALYIICLEQWS